MSDIQIGLTSILLMLVLIQTGMHIAIALLLLSFVSVWLIKEDLSVAGRLLALAAEKSIASYTFGIIPLFVVMGVLVSVSGVGRDTFDVAGQVFRRVRGGLGMATVAANAVFAAINGTSIASASVFTRIAVPELMRLGYTPRFSVGVVAGSSVLGMLIPPSLLLILFGIIAETSIGDLFIAGIVPGILLSVAFGALIYLLVRLAPGFVMQDGRLPEISGAIDPPRVMIAKAAPIILLIVVVLGGIYGGVFTAVEAGGVGAFGALILALLRRSLTMRKFWNVLVETGHVTASISFLIIGAHLYANMLALSGLPDFLGTWIQQSGIGFTPLLVAYLALVLMLGTILDAASIMLIAVPLILPIVIQLDVNVIWFGIITIIAVEVGLLTPPLGIACFVVKANLEDERVTLNEIFLGALPFALVMIMVLAIVVTVPWFALVLL